MAEGINANPLFPSGDPILRVPAPVGRDPITGQPTRGFEGLRPLVTVFPRIEVDTGAGSLLDLESSWQPVAALAAVQCLPPTNPGADAVIYDAFDRASFWLLGMVHDMPGPQPSLAPTVWFEVRASIMGAGGTGFARGRMLTTSWKDTGLICQVSGILASQWELWCFVHYEEAAGTKIKLRIGAAADRVGGGVLNIQYGTFIINKNPA